jgi:hypothetical protein
VVSDKLQWQADASEAAAALSQELSTLIAMSEKHLIPFLDNLKHSTWEAVRISGLADFDEDSNEYQQTTKTVQAGLESVRPLLLVDHTIATPVRSNAGIRCNRPHWDPQKCQLTIQMSQPDSPPLFLIIRPKQSQSHFTTPYKRDLPILRPTSVKRAEGKQCYTSEDECKDGTACSEHGSCAMLGKKGDEECWGCKCANGYAGVECQKADYSVYVDYPF